MISFFQVIPLMSVSTNSYFPLGKLPIAVSSTVRVALLPSGITRLCLPGATRAMYLLSIFPIGKSANSSPLYLCVGYFNFRFDGLVMKGAPDAIVELLVGI